MIRFASSRWSLGSSLVLFLAASSLGACGDDGEGDGGGGEAGATATGGGSSTGGGASEEEVEEELVRGAPGSSAILLDGFPKSIAVQGDHVIVAGARDQDFWIARFDGEGELDTSFGDDGETVLAFPDGPEVAGSPSQTDIAFAVTVTEDAVFVGGAVQGWNGMNEVRWGIAKLSSDGELDTSFGDDGLKLIDWTRYSFVSSIHVDDEGRIYVVGSLENPLGTDAAVARLLPNGDIDADFSLTGTAPGAVVGTESRSETGTSAVLTADRLVVGGGSDFALAGLTLDGPLDETFGDTGWTVAGGSTLYSMIESSEGGFVLAGVVPREDDEDRVTLRVARVAEDGLVDDEFGDAGVVDLSYSFDNYVWGEGNEIGLEDSFVRVNGLRELADGSWLIYADVVGFLARYAVLVKVETDGSLDTSFGQDGLQAFPVLLPLLSGFLPEPSTRLAVRGNVSWFVDEAVLKGGNRGVLIRSDLDALVE